MKNGGNFLKGLLNISDPCYRQRELTNTIQATKKRMMFKILRKFLKENFGVF